MPIRATAAGVEEPNDFPEYVTAPNSSKETLATNFCANTTGELYAYAAGGGTTNCPTPTPGNPTLNCQPVWTATPTQTNGLTTSPAIDTSLSTPAVYVGSHDGEVYAYNASTGALLWHSQSLGASIVGSLTISNGYIYVPEDYGWVYVFPSTTGTTGEDDNCWTAGKVSECAPDWGYRTGGSNFSTPAVASGMMYQAAGDHVTGKNNPDQYRGLRIQRLVRRQPVPRNLCPPRNRQAAVSHRRLYPSVVCSLAAGGPMERWRLVARSGQWRCLYRIEYRRNAGLLGQRVLALHGHQVCRPVGGDLHTPVDRGHRNGLSQRLRIRSCSCGGEQHRLHRQQGRQGVRLQQRRPGV